MSLENHSNDRIVRQTEYYSSPFFRLRQSGIFPIIMTIIVVAAFGAVIYYAYQRGADAGSDDIVPVVVADETAFKVKPDDPGGLDVPFRDALVFEQINEESDVDANAVEAVTPSPEEPLRIVPDELNQKTAEVAKKEKIETLIAPPQEELETKDDISEVAIKTAEEIKKKTQEIEKTMDEVLKAVDDIEAEKTKEPEVAKVETKAPEEAKPAVKAEEKTPEPVVEAKAQQGGDALVQLAAFRSEPQAEAAWNRFVKQYSPLLDTVEFRIIKADLGEKGIYYRLNASNLSKSEARSLCDGIKDKGGSCLVK